MRKGPISGLLGVIAGALVAAPFAFAGGTVAGKVTYAGKPEAKEFEFSKFPNTQSCMKNPHKELIKGEKRLLPQIELGAGGGLKNAVVAITDVEDKAFIDSYKGTDIVAEFCEFMPLTGVVVHTKAFRVENHDADPDDPGKKNDFPSKLGVLHNPHTFFVKGPQSATDFNQALPKKGDKVEKMVKFKGGAEKTSTYRLQCDQHEFMQGFFLPVSNPYYAVVKEDGSFELKDVPAGKHKIVAWHPFAGKVEMEVDVPEGGKADAKLEVKKK
jgi:hypothetical protein